MAVWDYRRWMVVLAALVLPAAALHAALSTEPPDVSAAPSLAGRLLIASPQMRDPFDHAVILLAQHGREGALGVIINHPIDSRPIAAVLQALGADAGGVKDSVRLFLGGPVSPNMAFVLHSAEYRRDDTVDIDGRVALSDAPDVLRDIGLGKGPSRKSGRFRLCRLGAVAVRGRDRARRLGHGRGRSRPGFRRRSRQSVDRRDGAVQDRPLKLAIARPPPHLLIYSNRMLTPP